MSGTDPGPAANHEHIKGHWTEWAGTLDPCVQEHHWVKDSNAKCPNNEPNCSICAALPPKPSSETRDKPPVNGSYGENVNTNSCGQTITTYYWIVQPSCGGTPENLPPNTVEPETPVSPYKKDGTWVDYGRVTVSCEECTKEVYTAGVCGGRNETSDGDVKYSDCKKIDPPPDGCAGCDPICPQSPTIDQYDIDSCGRDDCTGAGGDWHIEGVHYYWGTDKDGKKVECETACQKKGECCEHRLVVLRPYPACSESIYVDKYSPLIVDVFDSGVPDLLTPGAWKKDRRWTAHFSRARGFNLDGKGEKLWEWVGPNAGLLVYSVGEPPAMITGKELFGNGTFGKEWKNGYEPLATLDTNHDGKLAGEELKPLWVWLDANVNAVSERKEIKPASDYITEIPLQYEKDDAGDAWQEPSILLKDGRKVRSWDWWSRSIQPAVFRGKRDQILEVAGAGVPSADLSIYYWFIPRAIHHGLLRFVHVGAEVYVISAVPTSEDRVTMVYAKVSRDAQGYNWKFEGPFGLSSDSIQVEVDENFLVGSGSVARPNREPDPAYTWQGDLVTYPTDLPENLLKIYELLSSFTDAEFAGSVATFPAQGAMDVVPPQKWPGLQPAGVRLQDLWK